MLRARAYHLLYPSFIALSCLLVCAGMTRGAPVSAPYGDTFDAYTDGSQPGNFITHNGGQQSNTWVIDRGEYFNQLSGATAGTSATLEVTNLGGMGSNNFEISGVIRPRVLGTEPLSAVFGLVVLGEGPDLTNDTSAASFYLADISGSGVPRIIEVNSSGLTEGQITPMAAGLTTSASYSSH